MSAVPSTSRQKMFIMEHTPILNHETKVSILSLVMMEVGPSVVMESSKDEVNINLDALAALNEDVLTHIYNIMRARLEVLNQPAAHS